MRKSRIAALIPIVALLAGCVGAPAIPIPTFNPQRMPDLAVAAPVDGGDPAARAASLAAATDDTMPSTDSGWIAAYAELGIPVIDTRVDPTPIDPVGPHWSEVWALGGLSRGDATIPLTDAASVLSEARAETVTPDAVLTGLRTEAAGTDARLATLAAFVSLKSLANGGADPREPESTPDDVKVDAATLQLLAWEHLRSAFLSAAGGEVAPSASAGLPVALAAWTAGGSAGTPCNELWGTQDETSWINWIANKVGGPAAEKIAGETVGKFLAAANAVASLLSLIAQVNALSVTPSSDPSILIRDRKAVDGGQAQLGFRLEFDSSSIDANDQSLCALVTAANALGVGLSLPADGSTISGAEIKLDPIKNFPDKVYFNDKKGVNFTKIVTNAQGVATAYTQGRARPKDLPASAPERPDEYGFALSAQVEEAGAQSILNLFIDGLSVAVGGALSGALDAAKLYHFDIGETYFPFIDYQSGYRVEQIWLDGYRVSGEVCDLERPFSLQLDGSAISAYTGQLIFLPSDDGRTFGYSIQAMFGGLAPGAGNGNGFITVTDTNTQLFLDGGSFFATFPPPVGTVPVGPGGQHFIGALNSPIILTPDPTTCVGTPAG